MKKTIILLTLLFCSLLTFSQSTNWVSYRNELGTWNIYSKSWDWGEMNKAYIPVYFGKTYISLENKLQSYFLILEDKGKRYDYTDKYPRAKMTLHDWLAKDKDGKICVLTMTSVESADYDPIILSIMYDDIAFRFYCKQKSTVDSFLE